MIDLVKNWLGKFSVQLAVGICVGIGASLLTASMTLNNLQTRVSTIEEKVIKDKVPERIVKLETAINRHEQALERDFNRHEQMVFELAHKTDDQEKRLTRLETLVSETQRLLSEISADVKSLLRARK